MGWGNVTGALRWNRVFSPRLFVNTTLDVRALRLRHVVRVDQQVRWPTPHDRLLRLHVRHPRPGRQGRRRVRPDDRHYLRAGVGAVTHRFSPGALSFEIDGVNESDSAT